jgi:ATP/maltotriose-dependent transcriptional regulator MalT
VATFDPANPAPLFVGRGSELSVIAAAAKAATTGTPRFVLLEGEAGSGKTALLGQALATLQHDFVVARVCADEVALHVPYEVAAQLGATSRASPFATGQELLDIWSRLQEHGPAVVAIEDIHWADRESALAVTSAIKRLDRDELIVIVTSRPSPGEEWDRLFRDEERGRRLILGSFSVDEVAAVAHLSGVELTHREAERLRRHTDGHPIWVRTLLTELSPADLRATDRDIPAPRSLASAVTARISDLPSPARDLAAALAVVNQRVPLPVVGRIAGIAAPLEALEGLQATGFVRYDADQPGSPIEFSHPLFRLAVYTDLRPTRRRDLHRSAARVLTSTTVLAHRVAGADGADDALADELEAAAGAEKAAGALAVAARNLLWASALTGDSHRADQRLLDAALAFLDSGQSERAASLGSRLEQCQDSPARSLVLGLIAWELGQVAGAEQLLLRAVESDPADTNVQSVARAWAQLAELHIVCGRADEAIRAAQRALATATADTSAERLAWLHLSYAEAMTRGGPAGLDRINRRLPIDPGQVRSSELDLLVTRASIGYYSVRTREARSDLEGVLAMVRRGYVPVQLGRCHYLMAVVLTNGGEWDEAFLHARTAVSIAEDDRLIWIQSQCDAALGTLFAYRGDWQAAEFHIDRASQTAAGVDSFEALAIGQIATAALARARSQPDAVVRALEDLPAAIPMLSGLYFWPPLISALIELGRRHEASDHIARLARAADARRIDLDARLLMLRAQLASSENRPDQAAELFDAAIANFAADDPFLDRALLHHAYGRLLTARGNRREAIDRLRTAHELLSSAGAEPFIARVEADLAVAGLHSRNRSTGRSTLDLTDRERDVALLVARGMTNPEVAAQLYVSRKAVEYHLGNIYAKLGLQGRQDLRSISLQQSSAFHA